MDKKSYSIRIAPIYLDKLFYIAEYEDRSKNREIVQLIKKRIEEFEKIHGEITIDRIEQKKGT